MKKLIFLAAILFWCNSVFAAENGADILRETAKAMKYDKLSEFQSSKKVMNLKAMGQSIELSMIQKGNDKIRIEQKMNGMTQVIVKNGSKIMLLSPMYQELPEEQWTQIHSQVTSQDLNVNQLIEDTNNVIEYIGTEDYNGKSCKKVEIKEKTPSAESQGVEHVYIFVDAITKWVVGTQVIVKDQGTIDMIFSDMKKIKGFIYPGLISTKFNGQESASIEVTDYQVNIDLDDKLFEKQ